MGTHHVLFVEESLTKARRPNCSTANCAWCGYCCSAVSLRPAVDNLQRSYSWSLDAVLCNCVDSDAIDRVSILCCADNARLAPPACGHSGRRRSCRASVGGDKCSGHSRVPPAPILLRCLGQ